MEQNTVVQKDKKQRKIPKALKIIIAVLLAAAVLTGGWLATGNLRSYMYASSLLGYGNHAEAAEIFESLGDYRDSAKKLSEAKYRMAGKLMDKRDYEEAIEILEGLGEYSDSAEKLSECCYTLGKSRYRAEDYDEAYELFTKAGDYEDASYQAQKSIYAKGHELFLNRDFREAFECFESLEGEEEEYGNPHFLTLEDADEYLEEQLDALNRNIDFYVGETLEGEPFELFNGSIMSEKFMGVDIYDTIINYIPYSIGTASYTEADKEVSVQVAGYYAGDKILDAWENGDISSLTDDEKEALELAEKLIEQAKAETDSALELEIWLHDWICEKVIYESPDMDVPAFQLVSMRQLSCIGALLDGRANCQGYTDAFYLLGNMAGFEVGRVFGNAGEGHVWNIITLDGRDYIVDLTFDDIDDEEYGGWTYTFFNAPWDGEVYEIYGGKQTAPLLTDEFSLENSRFSLDGSCFDNEKDAARHIVSGLKKNSREWNHAVIRNSDITIDEFDDALDSVRGSFGNGKTWLLWVESYAGNTYVSVKFQ